MPQRDSVSSPETVTITFPAAITPIGIFHGETLTGGLTLTESGGRDAVTADPNADPPIRAVSAANGNEYTFGTDGETNSTTIRIQGRFSNTANGRLEVTIAGTDNDGDDAGNWTYTYIYHVTPTTGTGTVTLTGLTNGYAVGDFGDGDQQIYTGTGNDPVLFTPRNLLVMEHADFGGDRIAVPSGPISSAFNVYLRRNTTSDMVTATIDGSTVTTTGVYIYGHPTVEVDYPKGTEKGSKDNPGKPGEVLRNTFTVTVKDNRGRRGFPGAVVRFGGAAIAGDLIFTSGNSGTLVERLTTPVMFDLIRDSANRQVTAGSGKILYVRTDNSGRASVNYRLGVSGEEEVPVDVVGTNDAINSAFTKTPTDPSVIKVFSGSEAGTQLSVLRIQSNPVNVNAFDLYALVEHNGKPLTATQIGDGTDPAHILTAEEIQVVFTTFDGELTNTPTGAIVADHANLPAVEGPTVKETPNSNGIAQVTFVSDGGSNPQVTASLQEEVSAGSGVMRTVQTVTFDVLAGVPTTRDPAPAPPAQLTDRLTISTTGEGLTRSVTVNALTAANVSDSRFIGSAKPARLWLRLGRSLLARLYRLHCRARLGIIHLSRQIQTGHLTRQQ